MERFATKEKEDGDEVAMHVVRGSTLSWITISLPVGAFIACIGLSLINDFEASTATHCHVNNYLPSISAAISLTPQRYIWRICIALQSAPRLFNALVYHRFYKSFAVSRRRRLYRVLNDLACCLNIVEDLSLLSLTYISSGDNYRVHEASFITFMFTSEVYMLVSCVLFKWAHAATTMSREERKSMRLKVILFVINVASFAMAVYFFMRHSRYCEAGVYTYFALCEYSIVASNIAFHASGLFLDLRDVQLAMTLSSPRETTQRLNRRFIL